MEIYQLKHFYAIAENSNMTKAALQLSIAQPALSKSIRRLEEELGAALFIRNNKGMILTPQGKILMKRCEQIFSLLFNTTREISESMHAEIKINLCLRSGSELIGTTLSNFFREHSDVTLAISEDDQHGYDFLIDSVFSSEIPENAVTLLDEEICLVVSEAHPLAYKSEVSFAELSNEKFIVLSNSNSFQQIMNQLFESSNITPNISFTCSNLNLLQEMVSINMGISIAGVCDWEHSSPPSNVRLLHIKESPRRHIYLKKSNLFSSEILQSFERNLIRHFSSFQK